jgi:hypothetical protein
MSTDDGRVLLKATLFCPACGRQGHARTDWPERTDAAGDWHLVCPECGTALTPRPPSGRSRSAAHSADGRAHAPADD